MEAGRFVTDLALAVLAAAIGGSVARWLRLSPILGYLVAGLVIGPFTPGYSADSQTIANLAAIGVIFLLFSIGLGFSPHELRGLGKSAMLSNAIALPLIALAVGVTAFALRSAHPWSVALVAVVSSTAIGVALLRDRNLQDTPTGRLAIALLIVQDLAAIVLLVVAGTPPGSFSLAGIVLPAIRAVAFVVGALAIGAYLLPPLFVRLVRHASSEMFVIAFAAVALVSAIGASFAGLSYAFGAFIAGAVISEAAGSRMVHTVVAPFRDLFTSLFYVSVGMLIDPRIVARDWRYIAAVGGVAVACRFLVWTGAARLNRISTSSALVVGIAMVPLGEFNIVLAQVAAGAGNLLPTEYNDFLGVVAISIVVSTLGARLVQGLKLGYDRIIVVGADGHAPVTIIGYGRVGRAVADTLRRRGTPFAVLERDRAVLETAGAMPSAAVVGDGTDPVALDAVITPETRLVVTTIADTGANLSIIHRVASRPNVKVIARAVRLDEIRSLLDAGAATGLVPEAEGSIAFVEATLRELKAADAEIASLVRVQQDILRRGGDS